MKKNRWIGILAVVVIAGAAVFWFARKEKTKIENSQMQSVPVREGMIEQTVEATGEVAPLNRVEIKPPLQGRIESLLADEGDKVKQGEILAWMSSSDRAAIIDAARAKGPQEVKKWEDTYKPTPILAPLSGVVILRNIVVGQTGKLCSLVYELVQACDPYTRGCLCR